MAGQVFNERAFGIGCFHFAPRAGTAEQSLSDYLDVVAGVLKRVCGTDSNVQATCHPDDRDAQFVTPAELPDIHLGDEPYPNVLGGLISFTVEIPHAEQLKLASSRFVRTYSERFRIDVAYNFSMPVARVEILDATERPAPSDGVQVVREWLDEKINSTEHHPIVFQSLGPSPLHANFFLSAGKEPRDDSWDFALDILTQRGYDEYGFTFNPSMMDDDEALGLLFDDLSQELDVYYAAEAASAKLLHMWSSVDELTWSVVRLQRQHGVRPWASRFLRTRSALNSAFVALAEFEGTSMLTEQNLKRLVRDTYESDEPAYLKSLVDRAMADVGSYPTEQSRALLGLIETRRLSGVEALALFVSALGGGLVGALLTTLLGAHS